MSGVVLPAISNGTRYATAASGTNATEVQRRWVSPIQANVTKKYVAYRYPSVPPK